MTILLNIKNFVFNSIEYFMYNNDMTKQQPRKRFSTVFLILGMAFLAVGLATDQTAFTWLSIVFIVISLVSGGKWLRRRK